MRAVLEENPSLTTPGGLHAGTSVKGFSASEIPEGLLQHRGRSYTLWLFLLDLSLAMGIFYTFSLIWKTNLEPAFIAVVPVMICLGAVAASGGYQPKEDFLSLRFAVEHLMYLAGGAIASTAIISVALTYGSLRPPSRGLLLSWPLVFFGLSLLLRRAIDAHLRRIKGTPTVAMVGSDPELARLTTELAQQEWHGNTIRIDPSRISTPEQLFHAFNGKPDSALAIVLGPSVESLSMRQFSTLIGTHLGCAPVYTWEGFHEAHLKKVSLDSVTPDWIFQSGFRLGSKSVHEAVKRGFDIIASLTLAVISLLPMLCISGYIRCISPGPVLFFQERRGRFGKTFSLVKFRTMSVGSSGGTTTLGDKRIIPGGGFLRRYRLDELPQIYNILKGDMSLIGPRPEWIRCAERYSQEIELYDLRHLVRPGLTGWAQVNYPYGQDVNDARAKLSYDLFYIRNFSLLLDFVIVVKTAYVMIFGRGGR